MRSAARRGAVVRRAAARCAVPPTRAAAGARTRLDNPLASTLDVRARRARLWDGPDTRVHGDRCGHDRTPALRVGDPPWRWLEIKVVAYTQFD